MIIDIVRNHDMGYDFESGFIPVVLNEGASQPQSPTMISLQISWSGIVGTAGGAIEIIGSNSFDAVPITRSIYFDTYTKFSDSCMIIINPIFRFLKLKYMNGGLTGGGLNAVAYYE